MPVISLTSRDLDAGQPMPLVHAHVDVGGRNLSPHLRWSGPPADTQSYAVTMFDLDEPTGVGFVHWILFDLPVGFREIPAGAERKSEGLPQGVQLGFTDWGECGYGGPAPGAGQGPHRYRFSVHALDIASLDVSGEKTTYAMLQYLIRGHVLATAELVATYEVRA